MHEINYTIIIPHYNIPKLLRRLISTIPMRRDVEVIVVDDCSNQHLDEFSAVKQEYQWVKFYTTDSNGGAGKARNIGLRHATGRFILFADADDFFLPSLNEIFDRYVASQTDLVFLNAVSLDSDSYHISNRTTHLGKLFLLNKKSPCQAELRFRYLFGEPWCKLIKRELILQHALKFDEISIHNDTCFSYLVGFHAQSLSIDDTVMYCLTNRRNSVSKSLSKEKQSIRVHVFAKKNQFMANHNIPIFDTILINPLKYSVKHNDWEALKEYLRVCKTYNISMCKIIKGYLIGKLK